MPREENSVEAVDEPARGEVAAAPEDERRSSPGRPPPARAARRPRRARSSANRVAFSASSSIASASTAAPYSARRAASRSPRAGRRRRARRPRRRRAPRPRSRAPPRSRRPAAARRRKPRALPGRLRVRVDRADLVRRDPTRPPRGSSSRGARARRRSRTSGASNTSASSVAPTPPSREFSIGTSPRSTVAVLDRARSTAAHGRQRDLLGVQRRRATQRVVRVRPRRPEVGGAHQSSSTTVPRSPASARRIASSSSGESRCSPRPSTHLLAVQPRGVAVRDRGQHDAVALRRRAARATPTGGPTARRRRRSGRARGR